MISSFHERLDPWLVDLVAWRFFFVFEKGRKLTLCPQRKSNLKGIDEKKESFVNWRLEKA